MFTVSNIIKKLQKENGTNNSISILEEYKDNKILQQVLQFTYSPNFKYGIKDISYSPNENGEMSLEEALKSINSISERKVTGNKARDLAKTILESLHADNASIIHGIFRKTLDIGFTSKTINKVMGKGFIKATPYMGCVPYSLDKVQKLHEKYSWVCSQIKADGRYASTIISKDSVEFESRQGKNNHFGTRFDALSSIYNAFGFPVVLSGEIIIEGLNRQISNGALNSINTIYEKQNSGKDTSKDEAKFASKFGETLEDITSKMKLIVWDYIPLSVYQNSDTWEVSYKHRFEKLSSIIASMDSSLIEIPETVISNNINDIFSHYKSAINRGEEGTVAKGDDVWVNKKPTYQIKIKPEFTLDLRIVDFIYGDKNKKNKDLISSIIVESEDGGLITKPTNMSVEVMEWVTKNQESLLGTIVEVKCNGISKPQNSDVYSCMYPCVGEFRLGDKNVADTTEQCLAHQDAAIESAKLLKS